MKPATFVLGMLASTRAFVHNLSQVGTHRVASRAFLFDKLFSSSTEQKYPIMAEEKVMSQKAHGTSDEPVMKELRWKCDYDTADRICKSPI